MKLDFYTGYQCCGRGLPSTYRARVRSPVESVSLVEVISGDFSQLLDKCRENVVPGVLLAIIIIYKTH